MSGKKKHTDKSKEKEVAEKCGNILAVNMFIKPSLGVAVLSTSQLFSSWLSHAF